MYVYRPSLDRKPASSPSRANQLRKTSSSGCHTWPAAAFGLPGSENQTPTTGSPVSSRLVHPYCGAVAGRCGGAVVAEHAAVQVVVAEVKHDVAGEEDRKRGGVDVQRSDQVVDLAAEPVDVHTADQNMAAVDDGDSLLLRHVDRHRVEDRRLSKDHVVAGADLAELLAHDGVAVLDARVTRNWKRGGGEHR